MAYKILTASYSPRAFLMTIAMVFPIVWVSIWVILQSQMDMLPYITLYLAILLIMYIRMPRYYMVAEQEIIINRLIGNIVIPIASIKSIEIMDYLPVTTQKNGSGGVFGYFGLYELNDGTRAQLYCTRLEQVIVINKMDEKIVLSPADPIYFSNIVNL